MRSGISILIGVMVACCTIGCREKTPSDDNFQSRMMIIVPDSTYAFSVFMNDAKDPVLLSGIDFPATDSGAAGDLSIKASSSNTSVLPDSGLLITGSGPTRNLRIKPAGAGYSTVTVSVVDGQRRQHYLLSYAVSLDTLMRGKNWHTGFADASAAITIDDDYMLVANDETNFLYLYNRHHSGVPVNYFDFNPGNLLNLTDSVAGKWKEVDVEAGVRSIQDPSVIYWIGSMSNNSLFLDKPNRNRLFAVRVNGKKEAITVSSAGYYAQLRQKLLAWGDGHGYNFSGCAAVGKNCKAADGFNIEGMVMGPDQRTLFIGFRAPLVPVTSRQKALIAPVKNFEQWFNKGLPSTDPEIGAPIELDLGGRGIRDIISTPEGIYVIIAGSCGAELNPAVFTWSGERKDAPVLVRSYELAGLNVEGVVPVYEKGKLLLNKLQVLTDNGNQIFYGDTIAAKNLPVPGFKKFSSVIVESRKEDIPIPVENK